MNEYLGGADPSETMPYRRLEEEAEEPYVVWKIVYTGVVLLGMFGALLLDRIGADSVMMAALTLYMIAGIITVKEGIAGFANEGILTVLTLFIVAEGISRTGALDWYLGKLLGRPKTAAGAQIRLMIPIAIVSAFLNNTPIVVVMIPIVQKWSRAIKIPIQQLLIPLSFATILGGTCSLIG
jgi:di/tricarboxylate transporter